MAAGTDLLVLFETHATSADNELGLASGWFDAPLSPTGEAQARELGVRHWGDNLAAVFCSDLTRALRTAEIAFQDRDLEIVRDPRLREVHYGALTRSAASEIEARRASHIDTPFPGGESYDDVVQRVSAFLVAIASTFTGKTVLVVGHRATFYAFEHVIGRVPLGEAVRAPWEWKPGWSYRLTRASGSLKR